jgi:hypothetical protein
MLLNFMTEIQPAQPKAILQNERPPAAKARSVLKNRNHAAGERSDRNDFPFKSRQSFRGRLAGS